MCNLDANGQITSEWLKMLADLGHEAEPAEPVVLVFAHGTWMTPGMRDYVKRETT